jgi:ppGpp synthetase/RelA/SpoT-type nucleotidyltranferase
VRGFPGAKGANVSGETDDHQLAVDEVGPATVQYMTHESMLSQLAEATEVDFNASETPFKTFMTGVESGVQESDFFEALLDIHASLADERVVGKIRGVEAWADGEQNFRLVPKSWTSVVDKLYRINIEDNKQYTSPPFLPTIQQRAAKEGPTRQTWITPKNAHEVADDLIRTKFVVPFADGVVNVSDQVTAATDRCGLPRYRRYHAKDSGYHARHHYILIAVPGYDGNDTTVAVEVKILTKFQDTLGELTHLLYELKRKGSIQAEEKRKLAWLFDSPDFSASYVGHTGHFIEASIVELKKKLQAFEDGTNG